MGGPVEGVDRVTVRVGNKVIRGRAAEDYISVKNNSKLGAADAQKKLDKIIDDYGVDASQNVPSQQDWTGDPNGTFLNLFNAGVAQRRGEVTGYSLRQGDTELLVKGKDSVAFKDKNGKRVTKDPAEFNEIFENFEWRKEKAKLQRNAQSLQEAKDKAQKELKDLNTKIKGNKDGQPNSEQKKQKESLEAELKETDMLMYWEEEMPRILDANGVKMVEGEGKKKKATLKYVEDGKIVTKDVTQTKKTFKAHKMKGATVNNQLRARLASGGLNNAAGFTPNAMSGLMKGYGISSILGSDLPGADNIFGASVINNGFNMEGTSFKNVIRDTMLPFGQGLFTQQAMKAAFPGVAHHIEAQMASHVRENKHRTMVSMLNNKGYPIEYLLIMFNAMMASSFEDKLRQAMKEAEVAEILKERMDRRSREAKRMGSMWGIIPVYGPLISGFIERGADMMNQIESGLNGGTRSVQLIMAEVNFIMNMWKMMAEMSMNAFNAVKNVTNNYNALLRQV